MSEYNNRLLLAIYFYCLILYGCFDDSGTGIPVHLQGIENLTMYSHEEKEAVDVILTHEEDFRHSGEVVLGGFSERELKPLQVDEFDRVYIKDFSGHSIHVFDPDGNYVDSIGREGSGPGEFISIGTMRFIEGLLYVYDAMQKRMTAFSLHSFDVVRTLNMNSIPSNIDKINHRLDIDIPSYIIPRLNNAFLGVFAPLRVLIKDHPAYNMNDDRYIYYYEIDEDWAISEKLLKLKDGESIEATVNGQHLLALSAHFDFLARSLITHSEEDYIYTAWSDEFLIKGYDPDGNYLGAFYYPVRKREINRNEILHGIDNPLHQRLMQHADLPESWPVLKSIVADDENRLWVSTFSKDLSVTEWWILKNTGELIGKFEWPENRSIEVVKNGYVYTSETNELDVQLFTKYSFSHIP